MEERKSLTDELARLREEHLVTCGRLLNDPVDPRHLQPFYLGVAMATKWPTGESDPDSLQQFGQVVAAEWNMDRLFVGSPQPYARCPNTAMLVFLPDIRRAFLSSSSCEFLCQARGGPEVVTATLVTYDKEGPVAAVRAGMREVYRVVSRGKTQAATGSSNQQAAAGAGADEGASGAMALWLQRILFGVAVAALVVSLVFGLIVLLLAPGWIPKRRK